VIWDLPGPKSFLARLAEAIDNSAGGIVHIAAPSPRPPDLVDAILGYLVRQAIWRGHVVSIRGEGSPSDLISQAAGRRISAATLAEFKADPQLSSRAFVFDIEGEIPDAWVYFFRHWREGARTQALDAPVLIVIGPCGVSLADSTAMFGTPAITWQGVIGPTDTRMVIERHFQHPDSVLVQTAIAVGVEVSGWNLGLARRLASLEPQELVNPEDWLLANLSSELEHAYWENGGVDLWNADVCPDTAFLVRHRALGEIRRKIWRGQVSVLFPFTDTVRRHLIRHYRDALEQYVNPQTPRTRPSADGERVIVDPEDLELGEVKFLLKTLPKEQSFDTLLRRSHRIRSRLAHLEQVPREDILVCLDAWDHVREKFQPTGWNWPRSRQTLTILVGPCGAGKSTWAKTHCPPEDIVSADAIRVELNRPLVNVGDQREIFELAHNRVRRRLAAGRDAVFDATHLKAVDRLKSVDLAPHDIKVRYVVLDRDLDVKLTQRDWRPEDLVRMHHEMMQQQLEAILVGDGGVVDEVVDLRA